MTSFRGVLCNNWFDWIKLEQRYWVNRKQIRFIDIIWFERIKQIGGFELAILKVYWSPQCDEKLGKVWTLFEFGIQDKKITELCLFGLWFVSSWFDCRNTEGYLDPLGYDVRKIFWWETRIRRGQGVNELC